MRLNNQKSKKFVLSLYFVFAVLFVFASISFDLIRSLIGIGRYKFIVLIGVLILTLLFAHRVSKYFEYDSDGNVLVLMNKGMLLSEFFNYRENRAEFPKSRLLYYKLNNYGVYKSLNIYIKSNDNRQKRLRFNVTLVSNKKLKYLKQSLDKVVKQNKGIV
ncbi:MAG: hypothetical protein HKP06_11200 [Flavobacteriaceae bacterium]|nr:hypothetical protein [Flavobacteriaceae bacterium]